MFKNKFYILSLIVGLVLALILVVAQFPTARPVAKNVPVGIVNEDNGAMGKQVTDKLTSLDSFGEGKSATTLNWTTVSSKADLKKAMDQEKYYGAIVIPKDFSKHMGEMTKTGKSTSVDIVINQAMNATLANNIQVLLSGMITTMSTNMGQEMLNQFKANNVPLQGVNIDAITKPVTSNVEIVHSVKDKNSASSAYFQPLWMASLFATFLIYTAGKSVNIKHKRELWQLRLGQVGFIAIIAPIIGMTTTWLVTQILNYTYDDFWKMAFFSMIGAASFMLIMFALEMWLGFAALPVIALLMLFSAPLMQLAPEMIPAVYHDWLFPWLPIKFLLDGAKSIVYYGAELFNPNTWNLILVGSVGLVLTFTSIIKDWFLIKRQFNKA